MKDFREIHWENFGLRKSWLDCSILVSFFVLIDCKYRVQFLVGFGPGSGPVFKGCQLLSLKTPWSYNRISIITPRLHKGSLINPNKQFCCLWNLDIFHRIYLPLISVSFLSFKNFPSFQADLTWFDVIILDEIVFSQS